jgi:muramidase (phage lysozyme)
LGWAIPEYIVICESKGQNLPPNSATASGYYQILDSTWAENGGSPPDEAWRHSKSEQDRVAAQIWATGGPSQWVCA